MTLNGIDVSNWQPDINLVNVPSDFVIIKATEGVNYISPVADKQYQQAKQAGKLLGVYHFANGAGAEKEAQYFIANVKNYIGEAILVLDWEASVINYGVAYAKTFLDYVYKNTGVRPLIYMSKSIANQFNWSSVSNNYGLWVAQYANYDPTGYQSNPWTDNAPFGSWSSPTIFQYSSTGRLNGYANDLDLDLFYGDKKAWQLLAKSNQQPTTPTNPGDGNDETNSTPIVQYSTSTGKRAYAYTHWDAINGKPELNVLTSPNGTKYALQVDDSGKLSAVKKG